MATVFGGTIDAPTDGMIASPVVWRDHKGTDYRLSEMETSHLVNIVRLIVNEWAIRHGIEPVPIRNPLARLNLEDYRLEEYAEHTRMFCQEILYRLTKENLSPGYSRVWESVVEKVLEVLNHEHRLGLPSVQNFRQMLQAPQHADQSEAERKQKEESMEEVIDQEESNKITGESITISFGEEKFSPVQYHSFTFGGLFYRADVREGETPEQAFERGWKFLESCAIKQFKAKRDGFWQRYRESMSPTQ